MCMYVCMYVCVCLSVYPSICLSVSIHPSLYLPACLSSCLSTCLSVYLPVYLQCEGYFSTHAFHFLLSQGFTTDQMRLVEDNTAIVEHREKEIQSIVRSISELNEIFRDLATMVVEQVQWSCLLWVDIHSNWQPLLTQLKTKFNPFTVMLLSKLKPKIAKTFMIHIFMNSSTRKYSSRAFI